MKHLHLSVVTLGKAMVEIKVVGQTHRGDEFGRLESGPPKSRRTDVFTASNGVRLASIDFPAYYIGGNTLYVCGRHEDRDGIIVTVPRDEFSHVLDAVAEYNKHFDTIALPKYITLKETIRDSRGRFAAKANQIHEPRVGCLYKVNGKRDKVFRLIIVYPYVKSYADRVCRLRHHKENHIACMASELRYANKRECGKYLGIYPKY